MACEECDKEDKRHGRIVYFRWGAARMGLIGCDRHVVDVLAVLVEHQRKERERHEGGGT